MPAVIGFDIGSGSIKFLQLVQRAKKLVITNFYIQDVNPDEDLSIQLGQIVKKFGLKAKRVATSISGKNVFVRYLNFPDKPPHEIRSTIRYELGKHIPLEPVEVNYDFQKLGGSLCQNLPPGEVKIALVAVKKSFLNEHISLIESVGLIPEIIDVDSFCLHNAYEMSAKELSPGRIVAIIDIGASKTTVSISCDGFSFFTREVYRAGNDITLTIAKKTGVSLSEAEEIKKKEAEKEKIAEHITDVAEDIATDVNLSLRFFEDQYEKTIHEIILTGGGARAPMVKETLENVLERGVSLFDPLATLPVDLSEQSYTLLKENIMQSAVVLGLASRIL
jgi:type IV pilus assembly protein PilM